MGAEAANQFVQMTQGEGDLPFVLGGGCHINDEMLLFCKVFGKNIDKMREK